MGYAGGAYPSPTYHDLGDHTECVQLDFDPWAISFSDLLGRFFEFHDPTLPAWSRQYASVILFHGTAQKEEAEKRRVSLYSASMPALTEIRPYTGFTRAENYHQKFRLRQDPVLLRILKGLYPDWDALVGSTLAARLNGLLAGYTRTNGSIEELSLLGLPPEALDRVRAVLAGRFT